MKLKNASRNNMGFGLIAVSDWYGFLTHERFVRTSTFSNDNGKIVWVNWESEL